MEVRRAVVLLVLVLTASLHGSPQATVYKMDGSTSYHLATCPLASALALRGHRALHAVQSLQAGHVHAQPMTLTIDVGKILDRIKVKRARLEQLRAKGVLLFPRRPPAPPKPPTR